MSDLYSVCCDECGTTVEKETMEEAAQVAIDHDEAMHEGRGVPTVNGMPIPSDDVAEAAENAIEQLGGDA